MRDVAGGREDRVQIIDAEPGTLDDGLVDGGLDDLVHDVVDDNVDVVAAHEVLLVDEGLQSIVRHEGRRGRAPEREGVAREQRVRHAPDVLARAGFDVDPHGDAEVLRRPIAEAADERNIFAEVDREDAVDHVDPEVLLRPGRHRPQRLRIQPEGQVYLTIHRRTDRVGQEPLIRQDLRDEPLRRGRAPECKHEQRRPARPEDVSQITNHRVAPFTDFRS